MTSQEVLCTYIKKIQHPLKEIRERALCLLSAKLRLGWEFEDELSNTRELLECLLSWFQVEQPTLQCEALQLLIATIKVALIFGINGACRRQELANITTNDIENLRRVLLVQVKNTKNKIPRSFTIQGPFYDIVKKYEALRSTKDFSNRFFQNYQNGKCTKQPIGINKFGAMPKEIATFLNLPEAHEYTGHSFTRSSATLLADSGADLLTLKRHGGWRSSSVAEGYIDDSMRNKEEISSRITRNIHLESSVDFQPSTSTHAYIPPSSPQPPPPPPPTTAELCGLVSPTFTQESERETGTKSGAYIAKEFGVKNIISSLSHTRSKLQPEAVQHYEDLIETLRFINTMESDSNIPPLLLPSIQCSDSESGSSSYLNIEPRMQSSDVNSISNDESEVNNQKRNHNGIVVLLFPWVDLCSSESKTILLVEDALKLVKSTRRCCRFIRDVFLRDFPAEIFLNRPTIIKSLISIAEGEQGGKPWEALNVLLCITQSLQNRLSQLSSVNLVHETDFINEDNKCIDCNMELELQNISSGLDASTRNEDALAVIKQLPAPIFALDTLNSVMSIMTRSLVLLDTVEKREHLDLRELNTCLNLVESLTVLLLNCVDELFWISEHNTTTHRDIAHKSCMVMRLLGDLLNKYRKSFLRDTEKCHHRVAWIRLISTAGILLQWSRHSPLPPSSLVQAIQTAQLDPAIDLMYPELGKRITIIMQNIKTSVDQEHKNKYKELKKLTVSMDSAVQFMKNKNYCRNSKTVLICIRNSLACLEVHLSEVFVNDVANIILKNSKLMSFDDSDWSIARNIALHLMTHKVEWVKIKLYKMLEEMVKTVMVGDESEQTENEKCLILLCDVSVLTEICCHGLSSSLKEVESSSSEIMQYLLRGRLVVSEACWWRLLASLLPILPLLHAYSAHDTQIGQAICKTLELDIAECMGISLPEVIWGLTRLMFVKCLPVKFEAAHTLCRLMDDEKYLPPKESLRSDVLLNALKRVQVQDFNRDMSSSPNKNPQTSGLIQIMEVLKQDITFDDHGLDYVPRTTTPVLEASLRRSTLQQLSVLLRQPELHETFMNYDGIKLIVAILRMSLAVDDYLAFPECAISCVSALNSVCYASRHELAKIPDLPLLIFRTLLVFPANDAAVSMSAQILSLVAWSGFALQELDSSRRRVPSLPYCVTQRTNLPFAANSYWTVSSNAEHSSVEWLMTEEEWRAAIRVRWWTAYEGCSQILRNTNIAPPNHSNMNLPLSLRLNTSDVMCLRNACIITSCTKALLSLENATSHQQVIDAVNTLESYISVIRLSSVKPQDLTPLPWHSMRRFLCAPPASCRDVGLLTSLLRFILAFMRNSAEVCVDGDTTSWIKPYFIGNDITIISLLSRNQIYPQQTVQEDIEVTQLHIQIVKVLLRCIARLEQCEDYNSNCMESLLKILVACLEKIDLRNFHMLGYLNDLMRCIRYCANSRYCKLSEETLLNCLKTMTKTLSGCASGGGRKGQACRLDAALTLLALLRQIQIENIPVERWYEYWGEEVVCAIVSCVRAHRAELRAAALRVLAALAHAAPLLMRVVGAIPTESLSQYATSICCQSKEANIVREAALELLLTVTSRASPYSDVLECDVLEQLKHHDFIENCIENLVEFFKTSEYQTRIEPNVPLAVLERRSELEVRYQKSGDVGFSSSSTRLSNRPPPTAALVALYCDVIHNTTIFRNCPVQSWNERGLYRLLFRCASWSEGSQSECQYVKASACRAIVAATSHKCVRTSLAHTKDCIHALLQTIQPLDDDHPYVDAVSACSQSLLLLASLLTERSASDTIWSEITETSSFQVFSVILQSLESNVPELHEAALYCLSQVAQSANSKRHADKSKDESRLIVLESLKMPMSRDQRERDRLGGGDSARGDCQPDYLVEHYCKVLMNRFLELVKEMNNCQSFTNDSWTRVCSCLSSLFAISSKAKLYGIHRHFPKALLTTVQTVRDKLSLHGKPVDVIRNSNSHPVLRTLYWLLILMTTLMTECSTAKNVFAESDIALSLNRLWPWCMMTEQLRNAVVHLLLVFTNDCPKAWSAMSSCVGSRTLIGELCGLMSRESALQSRPRSDALLLMCLNTIRHCVPHQHCRSIFIKSGSMSGMSRVRVGTGGGAGSAWAALAEVTARFPDGATALLALRPALQASTIRAQLAPAIAHAAHHHRVTFLQSTKLLELLSGTLLAGDTIEIISAARAVWALAANSHKAKLLLRSAGVVNAVQSALQRLQKLNDPISKQALQLLTYTNTVLQTT